VSVHPTFKIKIQGAGKKFFRNWIFKNLSLQINSGDKISITGQNGSGKSTFLQVLAGYESLSEGQLNYMQEDKEISREDIFTYLTIAAPYLELIDEFTLEEIVSFHFQFKKPAQNYSTAEVIELSELDASRKKVFKYFSSGMKQRARLALAMLSSVELVLLDEPLSNLDKEGERWYHNLAEKFLGDKTVIVCSNQNQSEYFFCNQNLNIADYK
jgi:ABC-type multidrug transport system ATPase subunit